MKTSVLASGLLVAGLAFAGANKGGVRSAAAPAAPQAGERAPRSGTTAHVMLPPGEMQWTDAPPSLPPGAKLAVVSGDPKAPNAPFTMRLKVPAGYRIPPHFHPGDEHVTVIEGTFNMGMGDRFDERATTALTAGSFAVMPKGHHHFAWAKGETIVQVHGIGPWGITYVNPEDDPRRTRARGGQ